MLQIIAWFLFPLEVRISLRPSELIADLDWPRSRESSKRLN